MESIFPADSLHNNQFYHFFIENGFCVIEGLIDHQTIIEPIIQEYTELVQSLWEGWKAESRLTESAEQMSVQEMLVHFHHANIDFFQHLDISLPAGIVKPDTPIHLGQSVFHLMSDPSLLDVVQKFLGEEITLNPIQHIRMKPPFGDLNTNELRSHIVGTAWHQDMGVTLKEADQTQMITSWVAISDCPEESGCLRFFPKSHHQGLLSHCPLPQVGIPDSEIPDSWQSICLPVQSGSVIFFNPYVIHGASENVSKNLRWSFDLRYNVTGYPTGRPQFPEFILRSNQQPTCTYDDWHQGWLQTKSHLTQIGEDIPSFHRWNENAPFCA